MHQHGHGMGTASAVYIVRDDGIQIASAGKDGRIKIWSHSAEQQRQSDDMDCDGPMHSLAVSPDAQIIAAGTDQAIQVRSLDVISFILIQFYRVQHNPHVLTSCSFQIYDANTMDFMQTAATTQFAVRALSFAPTGDRLAAAGDDPGLLIVAIDTTEESSVKHTINVGPNTRCVAWDPAGTYIALAQTNGTIQIWDASTQQEVWKERCAPAVRLLHPHAARHRQLNQNPSPPLHEECAQLLSPTVHQRRLWYFIMAERVQTSSQDHSVWLQWLHTPAAPLVN